MLKFVKLIWYITQSKANVMNKNTVQSPDGNKVKYTRGKCDIKGDKELSLGGA
jgi:hypothetical protein